MKNSSLFIFIVLAFLFSSCADWEKKERVNAPTWSDDNSEIAYIMDRYERKRIYPTGGDIRNREYTIFLTNEELDGHFELSEPVDGFADELYYMKEAGYIISGSFSEKYHLMNANDGELLETFSPTDDKICKDKVGNFQTINVLPSIDGSRLVVLETRTDCTIDIVFWDIEDIQLTKKASFNISGKDFDAVAWIDENRILVSACEEFCSEKYYLVHVTGGVSEVSEAENFSEECLFMPTSSHWIDRSGQILTTDGKTEIIIGSVWDDEELTSLYPDFNEEYYQSGCSDFD